MPDKLSRRDFLRLAGLGGLVLGLGALSASCGRKKETPEVTAKKEARRTVLSHAYFSEAQLSDGQWAVISTGSEGKFDDYAIKREELALGRRFVQGSIAEGQATGEEATTGSAVLCYLPLWTGGMAHGDQVAVLSIKSLAPEVARMSVGLYNVVHEKKRVHLGSVDLTREELSELYGAGAGGSGGADIVFLPDQVYGGKKLNSLDGVYANTLFFHQVPPAARVTFRQDDGWWQKRTECSPLAVVSFYDRDDNQISRPDLIDLSFVGSGRVALSSQQQAAA